MTATQRQVRVTLEGPATVTGVERNLLRVRLGDTASVMLSEDWPGVTVEDVVAPRTWTKGDVVQVTNPDLGGTWTAQRGPVHWSSTDGGEFPDCTVDGWLQSETLQAVVLRYQHEVP